MTPSNLKLRPRSWLFFFMMLMYGAQMQAQCDTIYVDLTNYPPDYNFNANSISRAGQCCGAASNVNCVNFVVTLNPNTAAIRLFQTTSPAGGSERWRLNCGPEYTYRDTVCISGVGPHQITFCKPGSNADDYVIQTIAQPTVPEADSVRMGCSEQLNVYGMDPGTITWNSITGGSGIYNSYLTGTGISNPIFTPNDTLTLPFIDYEVCGSPFNAVANCGYIAICDTMRVYVFPRITANFNPAPATFCDTGAGSGVTVTATVSGGLSPYSYNWLNPSGTSVSIADNVFANLNGNYTLQVSDLLTDASCPAARFTVPVEVFDNPTINAGNDTTLCRTNPTALLSATVNGGGVHWFGGAGVFSPSDTVLRTSYTATAAEIAAGFVDLYVETTNIGAGCNVAYDTIRINFYDELLVSVTATPIFCADDLSTITAAASGGGGGLYAYQWNIGAQTASISQGAGNYTVSVTDAAGCRASGSVAVTAPLPLNITMASVNVSAIGICDGTATAAVGGGTGPYSFVWTDGQATPTATGLCYGVHRVTVTDINGCTITGSVVVNNSLCSSLEVSVAPTDLLCFGDNNGTLSVVVTGGTPDYAYQWSTNPLQSTITATGLSAGAYNVTVTDLNGCVQVAVGIVNQPTKLTNFFTSLNVSEQGGNDGEAQTNVSGGTAPYSYEWSNGANTSGVTGLIAGLYYVTITDLNNCFVVDSLLITQPPCNDLILGVISNDVECFADTDGSATVYGIGGVAPYAFLWNPGAFTTETVTGLSAGAYTVTVTDRNRCVQFINFNINEPLQLNVVLTPNSVSCFGVSDGTIEATVTGGTFPYNYVWSNGAQSEDLAGIKGGTYQLTVTDAKGCQFVASTIISEPIELSASSIPTDVVCYGDATGAIDLTVSGGTFPYNYMWSTGQTTEDINNQQAAAFGVTVTDANGCQTAIYPKIIQPDSLSVDSVLVSCPIGGAAIAEIVIRASGGVAPYQYSTDNGLTYGVAGDSVITVATGQTYQIVIRDADSCVANGVFTVDVPETVTIDSVSFDPCYPAGTTTVSVEVFISGGAGTQYEVSTDNGTSYATEGVYTFNLAVGATYNIIVRDSLGCLSDTTTIVLPTPFDASNVISNYNGFGVSCFGYSDGSIDVTVTGGATPYTYQWATGQNTQDLNNVPAGPYSLIITDNNGCTLTQSVTLTEPAGITATASVTSNYNGAQISCNGGNDGSVTVSALGGTGIYTYEWSGGITTANNTGLTAGEYTVTVNDGNACPAIVSVTLTEPTAVTATISSFVTVSCFGDASGEATAAGVQAEQVHTASTGQISRQELLPQV
jgi:hypothetical protein